VSKILLIDLCSDCFHCIEETHCGFVCSHNSVKNKKLEDPPVGIPKWCPLDDTKNHVIIQDDYGVLKEKE